MQRSHENQVDRKRIKTDFRMPLVDRKAQVPKALTPAGLGPVIVWQPHTVPGIANSIHKPQCRSGEEPVEPMVFDQNISAGNAVCFPQQDLCIVCMMQHIHKHRGVEGTVTERNCIAVKGLDGNVGVISAKNVNPLNLQVRARRHDSAGDKPVTASNVEQFCAWRSQPGHPPGKHFSAAIVDIGAVNPLGDVHRGSNGD
jgi:hypothetical protein